MLLCSSPCCQPLEKVESHRAFNRHVLHGYRPSTGIRGCLKSLFYLHNETVNVYTHVLYLLFLIVVAPLTISWPSNSALWWVVFLNLSGHISCMVGSVVYHLFNSLLQSASEYGMLLQFDIAGIWFANSMNTFNYVFLSFYCDTTTRNCFLLLHIVVSAGTFLPTLRARTPAGRAVVFALFALIRAVTTFMRQHYSTAVGATNSAWVYYALTDVYLFVGAVINAGRFPEKLWPGRFDFAFASHQVFHVIVIVALVHNMLATSLDVQSAGQTSVCLV